jgi:ribosomal protein L11 methyltransferase
LADVRKIVVVPGWEQRESIDGELVLRVGLGSKRLAWGFGAHDSTSLTLALLGGLYSGRGPRPRRVLDVGCGSGILSIACARLGAVETLGLDIAEEALEVARENAAANGVGDLCRFEGTPVAETPPGFDLVVANMLKPVLLELCEPICERARGLLILSGFKDEGRDEVVGAYQARGMTLRSELSRNEWHTVLLRGDGAACARG